MCLGTIRFELEEWTTMVEVTRERERDREREREREFHENFSITEYQRC